MYVCMQMLNWLDELVCYIVAIAINKVYIVSIYFMRERERERERENITYPVIDFPFHLVHKFLQLFYYY